jgi:hypothetical protein
MGAASSVSVRQPHVTDARFKQLLESKEDRKKLFDEICAFQVDEHLTLKGKINLKKVVGYFTDDSHALYPGFNVNVDIVSEAFRFTLKDVQSSKKTKKKKVNTELLSLEGFHKFLPVLLLFDRLWDMFEVVDKIVIDDKRVFKGEFVAMYDKLHTVSDMVILSDTTKDEWAEEFSKLDKNGDGFVNFTEFCNYCVAKVQKPFDFHGIDTVGSGDDEEAMDEGVAVVEAESAPMEVFVDCAVAEGAVAEAEAQQEVVG